MITCAQCRTRIPIDRRASALAVLTLHWMEAHTAAYLRAHPESAEVLADAGLTATAR